VHRRPNTETLHAWRKHVKNLRYAAEALDTAGTASKRTRRVARRTERLGELLGEDHDLALLAREVRKRRGLFVGERRTYKALLKLIARRRKRMRRRALRLGEPLYRRRPKRFAKRLLADLRAVAPR
jgi:CHAD domain-containing protein